MKLALAIVAALALGACSGNFGSGGSGGGMTPPLNGPQAPANPQTATSANPASANATTPPGDTVTYAFSQAPTGLKCPEVNGFSCLLKFNAPAPTPSPSPSPKGKQSKTKTKKPKPTASPSPTPSAAPTPSPSSSGQPYPGTSGVPSASPSPSGPSVTIQLSALPKDAPAMINPDPKALAATPLLALHLKADGDVIFDGTAIADFTLPKEQVGGRSYAIQLFQETQHRRKHDDRFVGTYSESTLDGTTLRFVFTPPKLEVKKDETWLIVLYGNEVPTAGSIPSVKAAPDSSSLPAISPSPSASASPTPTPAP